MPSCLAIFAHPDDVEYFAAGTMLQLAKRGWELHYFDLCAGNGGSVQMTVRRPPPSASPKPKKPPASSERSSTRRS